MLLLLSLPTDVEVASPLEEIDPKPGVLMVTGMLFDCSSVCKGVLPL